MENCKINGKAYIPWGECSVKFNGDGISLKIDRAHV